MGIFPNGASPYGVMDMSGNVWEWCLNQYGNPAKVGLGGGAIRVVRGGAWGKYQNSARTTFRLYLKPFNRFNTSGFRLVVGAPSV